MFLIEDSLLFYQRHVCPIEAVVSAKHQLNQSSRTESKGLQRYERLSRVPNLILFVLVHLKVNRNHQLQVEHKNKITAGLGHQSLLVDLPEEKFQSPLVSSKCYPALAE